MFQAIPRTRDARLPSLRPYGTKAQRTVRYTEETKPFPLPQIALYLRFHHFYSLINRYLTIQNLIFTRLPHHVESK
jgi:hypothetical protein